MLKVIFAKLKTATSVRYGRFIFLSPQPFTERNGDAPK
jgi:hypothetical protein